MPGPGTVLAGLAFLKPGPPFANFAQRHRRQHLLGSLHAAIGGRHHAKDEGRPPGS